MDLGLDLEEKIFRIKKVFDIDSIMSLRSDQAYVERYYAKNKIAYSIFHTKTGLIYMGISRDGKYKPEDLLGAARIIEQYVKDIKADSVLELATGRGANSFYLAQKFPNTVFKGVDISSAQLSFAKDRSRKVKNYFPEKGDYHDLGRYPDATFDIVFEVEALCYSTDKDKVLSEVNRMLKKDGLFILFDGYQNKDSGDLSPNEVLAKKLVEKGMALKEFESYRSFRAKANDAKFQVLKEEDLSQFVLPTMKRFEQLAARFFKHYFIARVVASILPKEMVNNAVAGYLMPTTMSNGTFCYMLTVLQKS